MIRWTTHLALALAVTISIWITLGSTPAVAAHVVHNLEGQFDGGDTPGGPFQNIFGMAVDTSGGSNDGNVYLGELTESETLFGTIHKFDSDGSYTGVSLDGSNTPQGSFSFFAPKTFTLSFNSLAVDNSKGVHKGDLYVADAAHRVVDLFDENGEYLCQITGGPTPTASECAGPSGSNTPDGGFAPTAVVVSEASGELYVADVEHQVIDKFNTSGEYIGRIADPHITQPAALGLDSTGALYVLNYIYFDGQDVIKFNPNGSFNSITDGDRPIGLAVDQATNYVYIAHGEDRGITEYDSKGHVVSIFGSAPETIYPSIAVNTSSGRVYAGNFPLSSSVRIFSRNIFLVDATTKAASDVAETTATLNGTIDPAESGAVTSCEFEYGPTVSYGQTAPCVPATPYSALTNVSAELSGLSVGSNYHFRLHASSASGDEDFGEDEVLDTRGPPTIDEQSSGDITRTSVSLRGKVNPHGYSTEYKFEYVDAEHFDDEGGFGSAATKSTPISELGDGVRPLSISQGVGGLLVGTTYHYRIVASNAGGTKEGGDETFTTLPVAAISDPWAYAHFDSATVEARINPLGLDTSCEVEVVSSADFELSGYASARSQPCSGGLVSGAGNRVIRAELGNLQSDTAYDFRFVLSNTSGGVTGSDKSFETFGVEDFSIRLVDKEGHPFTQAGGHPFESITHYAFNHTFVPSQSGTEGSLDAFLKDVLTEQPPGQVGGVVATPRCTGVAVDEEKCSGDSQVGTITTEYIQGGTRETRTRALYNVFTPKDVASRYSSIDPYVSSDGYIRTGADYGTTIGSFNTTEEARIVGVTARIWGVPADHAHDSERRCPGGGGCESTSPPLPMLRNPTFCGGPLTGKARVDTWQKPGKFVTATTEMPAITGCEEVKFDPTLEWQPTTNVADSPSGLHVDIHVPQNEDPEGLGVADLRDAVIPSTDGLILNPAGANNLVGCSPAQIQLHGEGPADCPDAAKVGTAEVKTSLLDHAVRGGVYIATPHSNPFNSLFAIYVAVDDPETGVIVKLAGKIEADPNNGQLKTTFVENPQLPIEDFKLDFFSGPRAVLRTPPRCGSYGVKSILTPWSAPESGPPVNAADSFRIAVGANGGPCASDDAQAPNAPAFKAGTIRPVAGAYTPLVLHLSREDGTQQIANVTFSLPPGLLGRLAGLSYCPDDALAAAAARSGEEELAKPSCPETSEVGTVNISAGAGTSPYNVQGKAYIAGPYKGAPLSLAILAPAVAGPYDLGDVLVRTALYVDLETAQITARSDPIPRMLEGISLDVRSISLRLDRHRFTLNPTKCEPLAVLGQMTSVFNQTAPLRDPFQVGNCRRLGFAPKLGLRLYGKPHRGAHPSLRAVLRMPKGGTNISRVSVTLPPSEFLDNEHIRAICTREQFAADACPVGSIYGFAEAWSPLLNKSLKGPVYLRSSNHRLPDLLADLNGQIHFALEGRIDSALGGIRANIESVPDVPVSKFVLRMKGGGKALLQNSANVCAKPQHASIEFEGQDGRIKRIRPALKAKCVEASSRRR